MSIIIRDYQDSDRPALEKLFDDFQDYLAALDPLDRLRRLPGYGEKYTEKILDGVKKNQGHIFVAEDEGKVVGFITGIIKKQDDEGLLDTIPTLAGEIYELYVSSDYRGENIGTQLMNKLEEYFKRKKCTLLEVGVFAPNVRTLGFYKNKGYQERMHYLIKKVG